MLTQIHKPKLLLVYYILIIKHNPSTTVGLAWFSVIFVGETTSQHRHRSKLRKGFSVDNLDCFAVQIALSKVGLLSLIGWKQTIKI